MLYQLSIYVLCTEYGVNTFLILQSIAKNPFLSHTFPWNHYMGLFGRGPSMHRRAYTKYCTAQEDIWSIVMLYTWHLGLILQSGLLYIDNRSRPVPEQVSLRYRHI